MRTKKLTATELECQMLVRLCVAILWNHANTRCEMQKPLTLGINKLKESNVHSMCHVISIDTIKREHTV
jgi:hypothetical protein